MRLQKLGLVLALASAVLAHGGEGHDMDGMSPPSPTTNTTSPSPPPLASSSSSYMMHPEHAGLMYAHIALMTLAWAFILPVAVVFSIARSRWTLLVQVVFLAINAVALFVGAGYNAATPDLYPGNAHHGFGWILTILVGLHVTVGFLGRLVGMLKSHPQKESSGEAQAFIPIKESSTEWQYHNIGRRMSNDSGHGTSARSSNAGSPLSPLSAPDMHLPHRYDEDELGSAQFRRGSKKEAVRSAALKVPRWGWRVLSLAYRVMDRVVLLLGFAALCTGIATYGRLFVGREIFSGLAHWIKGGVFFWFGILSLGRWSGAFGDLGWAWNARARGAPWRPSSEFVESATIFVYGITNIFLEHLGNSDGVWSPKDLEHASIAALFIGGGLLGMLVDSSLMRDFLNVSSASTIRDQEDAVPPDSYRFSLNPIPALVVLLVGKMMSSHAQADMVDRMVHQQWGTLLFAASLARMATYVLVYLKPPGSVLPSRPPTELLASFCLIAGGLIFMESAGDVVNSMKKHNIDVMFTYTVSMGVVGLLMAWVVVVMVLKGWAVKRTKGF